MTRWRIWLHGLAAAAIGGASTALSAALVDAAVFNFTRNGLAALGKISATAAAIAALAYLKRSPIPDLASAGKAEASDGK